MKNIVIFNQSSGYLTTDIANAFTLKYDKVALVVGDDKQYERKLLKNIEYKKIIKYNRKSLIKRIFTWGVAFVQILLLTLLKYRNYEVLFITNPPISYFVSLFICRPFDILIFDVYPDALVNLGIRPNNIIYILWKKLNIRIFKKARHIYTISEGMAKQISEYIKLTKIKIISIWACSESFKPINKNDNYWIRKHKLENKFIVLYSGNMGYTHNIETLVQVAKEMKEDNEIVFLFIGQGKKRESLHAMANEYKLNNCIFMDFQPMEELPYSLGAADLGVVTINNDSSSVSIPSKTFNLMSVGSPLLCICSNNSELSTMVKKYNNGKSFTSSDINNIVKYIRELKTNINYKNELSQNSINAMVDFSYNNALKFIKD